MLLRGVMWWDTQLKLRPYSSNMVFGACVTSIGDFTAQKMEARQRREHHLQAEKEKASASPSSSSVAASSSSPSSASSFPSPSPSSHREMGMYRTHDYNFKRTAIYASLVCIISPVWLNVLKVTDKAVRDKGPPTFLRAIKQGFMTWCLGSCMLPLNIVYLTTSFSVFVHGITDGEEIRRRISERLSKNIVAHMSASLCFWSIQWWPMFGLCPPNWRMVYGASMNMCWHSIASYIQHRS